MRMKKILCVLLALLIMISLAACGNDVEVSPPDDTATENTVSVHNVRAANIVDYNFYYQLTNNYLPVN